MLKDRTIKDKIINLFTENLVPIFFLILCIVGVIFSGLQYKFILNEIITRLSRNLFLVLSLIIPVIAGMGLNFALVIGAMAGQIGVITIKILNIGGLLGVVLAIIISIPFAIITGYLTGRLLNKTKGREMITSMILGFFANGIYQLIFLMLIGKVIPVKNSEIILSTGIGLKNAIDLKFIQYGIDNILAPTIQGVKIPVFTFILIGLLCIVTKALTKTKLGQDFRAVGQDLKIAEAAGIDTDKVRIIAITISTVFAAWGQILFLQSIGTLATYSAHEQVGMFAVAAILIGGATVTKATIKDAFIGTFLFHTLFIVSPMAGQKLFGEPQVGEYFRVFISYGVIAISLVLHSWQSLNKAQLAHRSE